MTNLSNSTTLKTIRKFKLSATETNDTVRRMTSDMNNSARSSRGTLRWFVHSNYFQSKETVPNEEILSESKGQ